MTYQVLARKWRPKKFADLVGQEHVVKALVNALDKGRLHHAYLLTGTRGVGKTTIARILAKSLNCPHVQHGEPCGECESCRQIDAGRYVDVLEIDAASNTGIDNIREVLENAQYAPTMGRYKVYIIDEVHMLSKSAFNAMLKTLEEPPEHVKFILATTDPQKVPVTVLSRCLQFVLRNLNAVQVHDHLAHVLNTENIAFEDTALQLLGRAAMGSMRDALSLLDQAIAMGSGSVTENDVRHMIGAVDKSYLYDLLTALSEQNGTALVDKAAEMAGRAIGFDSALSELAALLQRLSLLQIVPGALAQDDPEYETLNRLAHCFSGEQLQLYYQCAVRGKADLPLAPDEYAGFLMTLLRMLAFAPLAASAVPVGSQIAGTQLHNAAPAPMSAAPDTLPENAAPAAKPPVQTAENTAQSLVQTAEISAGTKTKAQAETPPDMAATGGHTAAPDVQADETAETKTETPLNTATTDGRSNALPDVQTAAAAPEAPQPHNTQANGMAETASGALSDEPSDSQKENRVQAASADTDRLSEKPLQAAVAEVPFEQALQQIQEQDAAKRQIKGKPLPASPEPLPPQAFDAVPADDAPSAPDTDIPPWDESLFEQTAAARVTDADAWPETASERTATFSQPEYAANAAALDTAVSDRHENAASHAQQTLSATADGFRQPENTAAKAAEGRGNTVPQNAPQTNAAVPSNRFRQPETPPVPLPPLDAANWPEILSALSPQLGSVQMFSAHTAVYSFDDRSGDLVLAIGEQGARTASKQRLAHLAEVLAQAYGRPISVRTEAWQDAAHLETPDMRYRRLRQEEQETARRVLEADDAVQNLIRDLGAEWQLETLALKGGAAVAGVPFAENG